MNSVSFVWFAIEEPMSCTFVEHKVTATTGVFDGFFKTFGSDYTLSASSPITIPAGQSSVEITVTPVDDAVVGERTETASLTITAGAGYTAMSNSATVSITDNDNTLLEVDAGNPQTVTLASVATTPGLWYGAVAGNVSTDPNPKTELLIDVASRTEDGTTPATTWSLVSGPDGAAVSFLFTSAVDTTATFTDSGVYVLRLTTDDGYSSVYDEVTITVDLPLSATYNTWAGGSFANTFISKGLTDNPDGDQYSNIMEFALGTDPTVNTGGSMAIDGSAHGSPIPMEGFGDTMELYFIRRVDHGTSGSVSYTVQFSDDLATFTDSVVAPTFVANSSVNSDYEVVKVAYPASARFGRIGVASVP